MVFASVMEALNLSLANDERADRQDARSEFVDVMLSRSLDVRGLDYAVEALAGNIEYEYRELEVHTVMLRF